MTGLVMGWMRTMRIGARLGIGFGLVVALIGSGVLVGFNVSNAQQDAGREVRDLHNVTLQLHEINFRNGEIAVFAALTAWEVLLTTPTQAVDAKNPNRVGYETTKAKLEALLAKIDERDLSASERPVLANLRQTWQAYFAANEKAMAAFKAQDIKGANGVLGTEVTQAYGEILSDTGKLLKSVGARSDAAQRKTDGDADRSRLIMAIVFTAGVMLAILIAWSVTRSITAPLHRAIDRLHRLARKDLSEPTDDRVETGRDEVTDMDTAVTAAVSGMREAVTTMTATARTVRTASEQVRLISTESTDGTRETTDRVQAVAATAQAVSSGIQTVSAGTQQMGASISEIARNANEAAKVASDAVTTASATNETVNKLGASSIEISNVVKLINSIAEQTNLLALNATIEAARAGDAGKGFAVVAGEVKDLAQATAKATGDISQRIEAIQSDTTEAVTAIGRISQVIENINQYQTTIASAVEEQTSTTNEISRSVVEIANGSDEIANDVATVATLSAGTLESLGSSQLAAQDLAAAARQLHDIVGEFRVDPVGANA